MKAYRTWDEKAFDPCETIVFAENIKEAKKIAMATDTCCVSDNFCILCGEMIPEGRQVCPSCENKVLHKAIHPKYNVGDVVYCYSCFNGELFPEKEPYVIYEVVVNTSAFGTKVFYRVKRTIDAVQTYDIFSERLCFETYEKCAHYCSAHNEL